MLTVEDNGVGLSSGLEEKNGIGLPNLRARLETLYGTKQQLKLTANPGGGVTVRIEIPWHEESLGERPGPA